MAAVLDSPGLQAWWSVLCSLSEGTFFHGPLIRSLPITFPIPSVTFKTPSLVAPILPCIQLLPFLLSHCHILDSFIPFNLSTCCSVFLQSTYHLLSVHSPAHFRPSSRLSSLAFFRLISFSLYSSTCNHTVVGGCERAQMVLIVWCYRRLSIALWQA